MSIELLPAREPAEPEGEEGDDDAGEVVGDVVPAEVEGRDDGDGEVGPEHDVEDLVAERVLHHQRDEQGDRDVERGEAGHGLHRPFRAVADHSLAPVEQRLHQRARAGVGEVGVEVAVLEAGAEGRQREVGRGAERPGQALRGGEPVAEGDVARPHQPGGERQRHERQEPQVDRGQDVGGEPGAEDRVQDRRRLVAEHQRPVDEVQLAVVLVLAHDEGEERLEVPVADVGDVEGHEPEHHQGDPLAVPVVAHPLARERGHQRRLHPRVPQRPGQEVEQEGAEDQQRQPQPRRTEEALGVDQGPVEHERGRDSQRAHGGGDSHEQGIGRSVHGGQSRDGSPSPGDRQHGETCHVDAQRHLVAGGHAAAERGDGVDRADALDADDRGGPAPGSRARTRRRRAGSRRRRRPGRSGVAATAYAGGSAAGGQHAARGIVAQHARVAEEQGGLLVDRLAPHLVDRAVTARRVRRASRRAGRRARRPPRGRG